MQLRDKLVRPMQVSNEREVTCTTYTSYTIYYGFMNTLEEILLHILEQLRFQPQLLQLKRHSLSKLGHGLVFLTP